MRCYDCKWYIKDISLEGLTVECHIPRKEEKERGNNMPSTFWVCEEHDKYGHREYIKNCPHYEKINIDI